MIMQIASLSNDESQRLASLQHLNLLDTSPEHRFDQITRLVKRHFNVDIALVCLVDSDRIWFKSKQGLAAEQTSREASFCSYTMLNDACFHVPDASQDSRFIDSALVTGDLALRFYAGHPLTMRDGQRVGTLCLMHSSPRAFSADEEIDLSTFAGMVEVEMQTQQLQEDVAQSRESEQQVGLVVAELEQLSLVAKQTSNAVIITDRDGIVTWVNEGFTRISGYSLTEVIGRRPGHLLQGAATDASVVRHMSEAIKGGSGFNAEIVNYHKNGKAYWISLSVEPVYDKRGQLSQFIAIETDISFQKKLEFELHEANALMASAARIAGVGVWQFDLVSNAIFWSEQTRKIHEVSIDFIPTLESAINFYPPEVHEELSNHVQKAIESRTSWEFELPLLTAKNRSIWVKSIGEAVVENDQVVKLIGTFQDVTQRRLMEKIQLEFISTVSHELRTPLTSIRGSLSLLASNVFGELPEKMHKLVDVAHRNSIRLVDLVNDILDMNKLAAGALKIDSKDQDLIPIIQQAIEATQAYAIQYKVRVKLDTKLSNAWVKVDQGRMIQVLVNLISNACKFSKIDGVVELKLFTLNSCYILEVVDHGIGIAHDFFPRIFAQFAQADGSNTRPQGGTGLGLNISKTLMEKMHGDIGFRSVEGEGSTFWISLPEQIMRNYAEDVPVRLD